MTVTSLVSIKDICERIFRLEDEHGLLDLEVDGVKVWQYKRMQIYYRIAEACGVISDPLPKTRELGLLRRRLHNLESLAFHSPFRHRGKVDHLIFDHSRSKTLDGEAVDIYSHFLIRRLKGEGKRVLVIEGPLNGVHVRSRSPERRHIEAINAVGFLDTLFGRNCCSAEGTRRIERLNLLVRENFHPALDLRRLLRDSVPRFHSNFRSYSRILAETRPECIHLLVGYSHFAPLVAAARRAGIKTVELQHGVISRYHLGYSFPGRQNLDYFADELETWGSYWGDIPELPLPRERVIDRGFTYFHEMKARQAGVRRKKNQVLVLSQTAIGPGLADKVGRAVERGGAEGVSIVYKLHPGEYLTWRNHPALVRLARLPNVDIVDRDCDLYRLFAESEYQLGVFSTSIFEGIEMGCKTMLFDLPGVEYMDRLAAQGLIRYFSEQASLAENLRSADAIPEAGHCREFFGNGANVLVQKEIRPRRDESEILIMPIKG